MTLRHFAGKNLIHTGAFIAAAVMAAGWAFAEFVNKPRCEAIWAETRMRVEATLTECLRSTVPLRTKIPTDAQLETAVLLGGPER